MSDAAYLLPEDDGLACRPSGAWARTKLHYLNGYIEIFLTGMKDQPFRGFNYIDLFAGPGKNRFRGTDEIVLGSPLVALTNPRAFSKYHFVENDKTRMAALKTRTSASPLVDRVELYPLKAGVAVDSIVKDITDFDDVYIDRKWSCLNFAFIDPDGLHATWDMIERLAQPYTMDMLIHYPQGTLNRNMKNLLAVEDSAADRFFGTREWRKIYSKYGVMDRPGAAHRELIDLYKSKLESLGYVDIKTPEPLVRNAARDAPLYRLILASKNPRGLDFWKKVAQIDPGGQMGFKWD